jgi:hypothetical protein
MRPRGLSPLPVRPLRLSPKTATVGGRPTATPGPDPHQLAAVTPPAAAPRRTRAIPQGAPAWSGESHRGVPVRSPIPGAGHCMSRPEPVKGA